MKFNTLTPVFVKYIPRDLEDGKIYISREFQTAIHLCACGCGMKTVTPFSKGWWSLTENGNLISLYPSIGNHQFPCKSHYMITDSKIIICP